MKYNNKRIARITLSLTLGISISPLDAKPSQSFYSVPVITYERSDLEVKQTRNREFIVGNSMYVSLLTKQMIHFASTKHENKDLPNDIPTRLYGDETRKVRSMLNFKNANLKQKKQLVADNEQDWFQLPSVVESPQKDSNAVSPIWLLFIILGIDYICQHIKSR